MNSFPPAFRIPRPALALCTAAFALIALPPTRAQTQTGSSQAIDWLRLFMGLFGSLALFLFGMEQMSKGLKAAAGDSLKALMERLTKNRFTGAATGAFVTAVLNSSSVTTVLVVGFITAGVMSFSQSIGVIMGANIGSTFTAQIVAFNVTQYALLLVASGLLTSSCIWSARQTIWRTSETWLPWTSSNTSMPWPSV